MPPKLRERDFDLDNNEQITAEEIALKERIELLEQQAEKADSQRRMAWVAIISMIAFTAFMFSPFVPEGKATTLANISDVFFVAMASIVGAFMGFTSWVARK